MASSRLISCISVFVVLIGCGMIAAGIVGIILGSDILQNQVNIQLPLNPYSDQLDSWESPPVPIYLQFWLWECVNIEEVSQGEKPAIFQRGPFTYHEYRKKHDVRFNENHTVTYRQPQSYTFAPDMSVSGEDTELTMINVPLVTIVSLLRSQKNRTQEAADIILKFFNESLFITRTVGEWIWGYEDPLLKAAMKLPIIKDLVKDDHFGYFYGQNATDDGLYTVFTGKDNIEQLNLINKWNGVSYLNYWNSSFGNYANQINGTDGSWFPPLYKKDLESQRLYLFSTDICRSLYAKFAEHSSVLDIPTELFTIPSEVFANSTINPDNIPYGTNHSGVLNVSVCRDGAPIIISLPHLLYADDEIQSLVVGIQPDEHAHRTIFEVEPHTGLVLRAQKRLQVNIFLEPDVLITEMKGVKQVVLPAIWLNESTVIDTKSANDLKSQVLRPFALTRGISIGLIPFGLTLFGIITIVLGRRRSRRGSSARLLFAESHNTIAHQDE